MKQGGGGEICGYTDRQKDELKPETSLGEKMMKLKLPYFGHILRRQGSLAKTVMLQKIEGSRERRTQNLRQIDSIKEAVGAEQGC